MNKTIKLSEYCFERDDIDYSIVDNLSTRYGDRNVPNQPFNGVIQNQKDFEKLLKVASSAVNEPEQILHNKTVEKWITEQGGTFSLSTLLQKIDEEYYNSRCSHVIDLPEDFIAVVHNAMYRSGLHIPRFDDWITTNSIELYHTYKGDHRSVPGITGRGDRRDRENRVKAISQAKDMPTQLDPAIAGMRYKDGKYRNIFIDSFANYFRGNIFLSRLFSWIENIPMNVHYSDMELAELIVMSKPASAYAADYKGMDFHFYLDAFLKTLDILEDILYIPHDQIAYMKTYVEELFYQHLITPKEVYVGIHALFSGIYPTHDIEGYMNMFTLIYTFTKLGFIFVLPGKPLRKDEFTVIVCGDDSIVLLGSAIDPMIPGSLHASVSQLWGQELELSKVEYSEYYITFCKKTFALRRDVAGFKRVGDRQIPIYKYSVAKCLNAIRHPENMPSFPSKKDLVVWVCSIFDCAYGCTSWKSTVITMVQLNPQLFALMDYNNPEISTELETLLNADWWFRNYAEFSLPKSPTFQVIKEYLAKVSE